MMIPQPKKRKQQHPSTLAENSLVFPVFFSSPVESLGGSPFLKQTTGSKKTIGS